MNEYKSNPNYIRASEAARIIGVSKRTINWYVERNLLKFYGIRKKGVPYYLLKEEVKNFKRPVSPSLFKKKDIYQYQIDEQNGSKHCRKCDKIKEIKEFKLINGYCGLHYGRTCLECAKKEKSEYQKRNRVACNILKKKYRDKKKGDIKEKLNVSMRHGLSYSLSGRKNNRHWEDLVGYTNEQLKKHIESQFTEGMSWDRYSGGEIHIDHILPISLFEFNDINDIQFKICWSLDNLQPLWKSDNLKKGDCLDNGMRTQNMTKEQKLEYLRSKGFNV
jgi:hypothetical protein